MMTDLVTLNYCAHAIEATRESLKSYHPSMAVTRKNLYRVTELLERAQKFILPEMGELVDLQNVSEAHRDMLRLPYPLIALESPFYTATGLLTEGPLKESKSSRRIALAFDESFAQESGLVTPFNAVGLYLVVLFYDDAEKQWFTAPMGAFIPRETTITHGDHRDALSPSMQLMLDSLVQQGAAKLTSTIVEFKFFDVLPELTSSFIHELGFETAHARMQMDLRDELMTLWGFCITVNCANIRSLDIAAPQKLNEKRIKNGKLPFYAYKVLDISPESSKSRQASTAQSGDRLAPRMHLRRGHPRRLPDSRVVYVRAAMIGSAHAGIIQKDYRVLKPK